MSAYSLYEWRKKYAGRIDRGDEQSEEIRRLKRELARVTEEERIALMATNKCSDKPRWRRGAIRLPSA